MLEYFTLGYYWIQEYPTPGVLLDTGVFYPGYYWMQEYFTQWTLLNTGIFHPRDTTGRWDISPQRYYSMLGYFTPGVLQVRLYVPWL